MCNYSAIAYVSPLPGEADTSDKNYTVGFVSVLIPGDVTGIVPGVPDGNVDMRDIAALCSKFLALLGIQDTIRTMT